MGLKTLGSAVPSPHSRSRNVFVPKWMIAPTSRSCHSTCWGEGLKSTAFWAISEPQALSQIRASNKERKRGMTEKRNTVKGERYPATRFQKSDISTAKGQDMRHCPATAQW